MNHKPLLLSKSSKLRLPSIRTILVLAAILRLASIALVRSFLHPTTWEFGPLAQSIATGFGYSEVLDNGMRVPAVFMPPGYAYVLAAFYKVGGERPLTYAVLEILQAGCGVLLIYIIYRLASILIGRRGALAASLLVAIFPTQIYTCNEFHGISIYIIPTAASVLFLTTYCNRDSKLQYMVIAGLSMGVLMLFRGEAPALTMLFAAIVLLRHGRAALWPVMIFLVVAFSCLAPWTLRNYLTFHQVIPVCKSAGYNLWVGNNPRATGSQHYDYANPLPADVKSVFDKIRPGPLERVQRDDALERIALNYIKSHIAAELKLATKKLWIFFVFDPAHQKSRNPAYWLPSVVVTLLALYGAVMRGGKLVEEDIFVFVSILFSVSVCMVVFALPRYKIIIDPFVMVLAASVVTSRGATQSHKRMDGKSPHCELLDSLSTHF